VHPSADSPAGCRLESLEMEHPEPARAREMLAKLGLEATLSQGREPRLKATLATPKGRVQLS
jgi:hypothetical protein